MKWNRVFPYDIMEKFEQAEAVWTSQERDIDTKLSTAGRWTEGFQVHLIGSLLASAVASDLTPTDHDKLSDQTKSFFSAHLTQENLSPQNVLSTLSIVIADIVSLAGLERHPVAQYLSTCGDIEYERAARAIAFAQAHAKSAKNENKLSRLLEKAQNSEATTGSTTPLQLLRTISGARNKAAHEDPTRERFLTSFAPNAKHLWNALIDLFWSVHTAALTNAPYELSRVDKRPSNEKSVICIRPARFFKAGYSKRDFPTSPSRDHDTTTIHVDGQTLNGWNFDSTDYERNYYVLRMQEEGRRPDIVPTMLLSDCRKDVFSQFALMIQSTQKDTDKENLGACQARMRLFVEGLGKESTAIQLLASGRSAFLLGSEALLLDRRRKTGWTTVASNARRLLSHLKESTNTLSEWDESFNSLSKVLWSVLRAQRDFYDWGPKDLKPSTAPLDLSSPLEQGWLSFQTALLLSCHQTVLGLKGSLGEHPTALRGLDEQAIIVPAPMAKKICESLHSVLFNLQNIEREEPPGLFSSLMETPGLWAPPIRARIECIQRTLDAPPCSVLRCSIRRSCAHLTKPFLRLSEIEWLSDLLWMTLRANASMPLDTTELSFLLPLVSAQQTDFPFCCPPPGRVSGGTGFENFEEGVRFLASKHLVPHQDPPSSDPPPLYSLLAHALLMPSDILESFCGPAISRSEAERMRDRCTAENHSEAIKNPLCPPIVVDLGIDWLLIQELASASHVLVLPVRAHIQQRSDDAGVWIDSWLAVRKRPGSEPKYHMLGTGQIGTTGHFFLDQMCDLETHLRKDPREVAVPIIVKPNGCPYEELPHADSLSTSCSSVYLSLQHRLGIVDEGTFTVGLQSGEGEVLLPPGTIRLLEKRTRNRHVIGVDASRAAEVLQLLEFAREDPEVRTDTPGRNSLKYWRRRGHVPRSMMTHTVQDIREPSDIEWPLSHALDTITQCVEAQQEAGRY